MEWSLFKRNNKKEELSNNANSLNLSEKYNEELNRFPNATYTPIFTFSFNGEKTPGEIGIVKDYDLDYNALRSRSWQSYIENEITQTVVNRFITWVIGSGLKLQSEPIKLILESNNIKIDSESISKLIEAKFTLFAKDKNSDYCKTDNLNRIAWNAKKEALLGGDCLVILRSENNRVTVQLVDGYSVQTPFFSDSTYKSDVENGYRIENGIVMNKKGEHIAYYVRENYQSYKRVSRMSSNGIFEQAFMIYGLKYRLKNNRGIPLISTSLETLKKLDRYKEATVGTAEETAKIAYTIEHDVNSTGENPLARNLSASLGLNNQALDVDASQTANNIAATTQKQVFNMPIGSKVKTLDSKNELYFKDFYRVNVDMICASLGIPPEVALSKYDSNFSASRAALKDWEHSINVSREDFTYQFYQKIFSFWLALEVVNNRINLPGYFEAITSKNNDLLNAYNNARFVGSTVPHIDPLKEVKAEREKLGELGKHLPLTTAEAATETLNGGDYNSNQVQYYTELSAFPIKPHEEAKKNE